LNHTHRKMKKKLDFRPEDSILDVSSGTGLMAEAIINKSGPFKRYVANDPSTKMQEVAKYRLRYKENVEFTGYFAEKLPFEENSFDHIICINAFHYYVDQPAALAHFRRVLKPEGNLWVLNWNRVGTFKIANWIIKTLSAENINTPSVGEMKKMLTEQNFTIKDEETWGYWWWKFFFLKCN